MSESSAEAALIERLRNRDPEGLAAAYDRYSPLVYSLFLRITRDQSIAEDLVQELFIRVWSHARSFDASKGALGVWILSIARNMAIDHMRSAQARFATRLRPIEHADKVHGEKKSQDPESLIDQARTVQAAFAALTLNQKRVLELAYFEGFSQSEIAQHLQEPLGTVKSWMRSALLNLRAAIKGGDAK
ncbi:MAG: sigma-70 family RNA polymerase sigma factor [Acidobacteriaceae bacterium]|nr:sigma-70 family RNA polymerase sigma factor [Acidobacteriaceae bacterium]MBV9223141.1 sigma-70 family RNA polymerase sigma factor [Acidobacteriaceae bacterium]MBV9305277.1 sigma-70 family RNA polymerase sigma factor [Acidobacteriaceae bacterium]MBV9678829.1 sigma-70 family RNA polymerase sigma factor [Acidobacteriaceae bacterium]MBV9940317.1 sigma-70 family RNA polymerase sigma factor [Acidobacteriaceae bacterium]